MDESASELPAFTCTALEPCTNLANAVSLRQVRPKWHEAGSRFDEHLLARVGSAWPIATEERMQSKMSFPQVAHVIAGDHIHIHGRTPGKAFAADVQATLLHFLPTAVRTGQTGSRLISSSQVR